MELSSIPQWKRTWNCGIVELWKWELSSIPCPLSTIPCPLSSIPSGNDKMHITLLHTNSVGEGGETGQLLQHPLDFLRAKIEIMQMICVFENFRTYCKIKLLKITN